MNILNVGRCSRCIASEVKTFIKNNKIYKWRYCNKHQKWCRGCSAHCEASPMGIEVITHYSRNKVYENISVQYSVISRNE